MSPTSTTLQSTSNDLRTLARWMSGHFSNVQQALNNPKDFAHIHVCFRPLPFEFFSGIGLYAEQAYDYDLWSPYRQAVHHLIPQDHQIYIETYSVKNGIFYAGSGRDLNILKTLTPDCLERRYNCSMVFERAGDRFEGAMEPGQGCLIEKRGCQTYLDSRFEITENTWLSLDRGMDVTSHQQVWGSVSGPFLFEKRECFAHEVPNIL